MNSTQLPTPAPSPARRAGGVFGRLDAEWATLCTDDGVRAAVTDWLHRDQLAEDIAAVTDSWTSALGPEHLLAALRPSTGSVMTDALADAVLRALLRRATGHDRSAVLAARIIVQAMLPAAVRMTRGQVRPFGGRTFDDVGHLTIAALFETARTARIADRPGRPAANLALDALGRVCRELAAEAETAGEDLAAAEQLTDPAPGPAAHAHAHGIRTAATAAGLEPATGPSEAEAGAARLELLELLLDAMEDGSLSPADARAIAWHYRTAPLADRDAAATAATTPGAWQRRRSRAVARLTTSLRTAA